MGDTQPSSLPRNIEVTIRDLREVEHRARVLARLLPDLHVLAYERQVHDDAGRSQRSEWYLDEQGIERAKVVLRAITDERSSRGAKGIVGVLTEHLAAVNALFSGPGADNTLRGTLLGDDKGHGAQKELTEALKAQERRTERGEYTPARTEPQQRRVGR